MRRRLKVVSMALNPMAGKPPAPAMLADIPKLISSYYTLEPDPAIAIQRVSFGTSGHRGSSLQYTFNERHILAITAAICDYRKTQGIDGPLFLAKDTHALSEPAFETALAVLCERGADGLVDADSGYTPTPALSHAILKHNQGRTTGLADGIVITPSHNPPEDGGFKYNSTDGGPADTGATKWIQDRANELLKERAQRVRRCRGARKYDYTGS